VAGIVESGAQSAQWIELRKRWMGLVLRRTDPEDRPIAWRNDLSADLADDKEEIATILSLWEPPIPAVDCLYEIETADYPVPSDMRG